MDNMTTHRTPLCEDGLRRRFHRVERRATANNRGYVYATTADNKTRTVRVYGDLTWLYDHTANRGVWTFTASPTAKYRHLVRPQVDAPQLVDA